jgi:hypothetical protein
MHPRHGRPGRRTPPGLVVAAAAVAGAVLAVEPTGTVVADQLWCGAFAGGVAWAGSHARREVVLVLAAVAVALAETGLSLSLAVAAVAVAAGHALMARDRRHVGALVAGLVALSLLTGSGQGVRWQAALTTTVVAAVLVVAGLLEMSARRRRVAVRAVAGLGLAVVVVCLLAGVAYLVARPDLDRGVDAFRAARDAGRTGDLDAAVASFRTAEQALDDGRSWLSTLGGPGRAVPGLAQQLRAADEAVEAASDAAASAGVATGQLRLDRLRVEDGALDLDAIAEAEPPVSELVSVLDRTVRRIQAIDRTLLVAPVVRTLDDATEEALEAGRTAERLQRAIRVAPDLLGADGPRRYLVLFTTPVEARNRFGFPGTYAVMRLDGGRISFEEAGPIQDVFPEAPFDQAALALAPRAQPYQPYGVSREWRSVTIPAHFPAVADTAVQLAAQSPLGEVHGVLLAGPETAAAVVGLVGDVSLEDPAVTLTEDTTVDFVTRRQYLEFPEPGDQADRKDLLADIAEIVGERLETITLPELGELFDVFSPLVRADQLVLSIPASVSPEAAVLLDESDLDGAMPRPADAGDVLHVGHLNAAGNKIDLYLRRRVTYDVEVSAGGVVTADLTVELENRAPASGRPPYLIGSSGAVEIPPGTNRTTVLVTTPHAAQAIELDGEPLVFTAVTDGGLVVHQVQIDLAPGQTRTLTARLDGTAADGEPYRIQLLPNGLVAPDQTTVRLRDERSGVSGEVSLAPTDRRAVVTHRGEVVVVP